MSKLINLTGQRFGFWVVKNRIINNKNGQVQWLCLCECGKEKSVSSNSLRSGNSTSCGCNHTPDLTGRVFENLTVLALDTPNNGKRYWLCQCVCGKKIIVNTFQLRENKIKSCGCKNKKACNAICNENCPYGVVCPLLDEALLKNLVILTKLMKDINNKNKY